MGAHDVLAAGSLFAGCFRIVELLSEREMGKTYLVEDLPKGKQCVLNAMDTSLLTDDAIRETFAAQVMRTWRVSSAHVLQTIDAGIDGASGRPWFTTEILSGEDLASRVRRWGAQPLPEVRALLTALGDALGKAHAQGLVHYDLRPENIQLGPGKPFSVTVRELTISRVVADACAADGHIVGTAIWMPPEQFDLGGALAPTANVWSLGLLAFYAATGKTYWLDVSDDPVPSEALLGEILLDPVVGASARAKALGCEVALLPWFDAWFARCVTRDADQRFPDAAAACAAFIESFRRGLSDLTREVDDDQTPLAAAEVAPTDLTPTPLAAAAVTPADPTPTPSAAAAVAPTAPTPTPPGAAAGAPMPPGREKQRHGHRMLRYATVLVAGAAALGWFWKNQRASKQDSSYAATHGSETSPPTAAEPPAPARSAPTATEPTPARPAPTAMEPPAPAHSTSPEPVASDPETVASSAAPATPDTGEPRPSVASRSFAVSDVSSGTTDFSLAAALKALKGIYYGKCALPSAGKVTVTFAPSGRVKKVAVQGEYNEQTTTCVAARFSAATVAPFRGAPQTLTATLVATR
jgi:serine/threonine protein kinase